MTLLRAASGAVAVILAATSAYAQAPTAGFPTALVDNPCPPPLTPPARDAPQAERDAFTAEQATRAQRDWANLCRYKAANATVTERPRVVFMGDSITQGWARDAELFKDGVVGRGISAQTTPQMLVRFYPDVIALRPQVVHIMAGTNDAAGNTGPTTMQDFKNNIMAMVDLARANGVKVVLGSIPPAAHFYWSPTHRPAETIVEMNRWLRAYAQEKGLVYADYYTALAEPNGAFKASLANDGVHPTAAGYAVMRPIALQAIAAAMR
jgi:lysophospholipase L1-like esterase